MIRYFFIVALFIAISALNSSANAADIAVIVNKDNTAAVDKAMIVKIYKGDMSSWPGNGAISCLDQPESSAARESFSSSVLGKTVSNMKALWAQNIFTGKAIPPKVLNSDDEIKKFVSSNKNAIGYIKASGLDDSVKAVLK